MKKLIDFFWDKKLHTIIIIIIGVLILLMLFFGIVEYTFGFFDRMFTFYDKTTFALLIIAFIVTSKMYNDKEDAPVVENTGLKEHIETYAQLSEVLFFVLRDYATEFSMISPRDVVDIQEKNMVIEKYGVSFYQFRSEKADLVHSYTQSELENIKNRLQRKIDIDIKEGRFTTVNINSVFVIDKLSDYSYNFGIQIVIPDDNYYYYKNLLDVQKKTYGRKEELTEGWNDK